MINALAYLSFNRFLKSKKAGRVFLLFADIAFTEPMPLQPRIHKTIMPLILSGALSKKVGEINS